MLTILPSADVTALLGGSELQIFACPYFEELARDLVEIGRAFWFEHVQKDLPPPVDGSESWRRYLRARWPSEKRSIKRAPPQAEVLVEGLFAAKELFERTRERKVATENALKLLIGDAAGLRGATWEATWKATRGGAPDWKTLALELGATPDQIEKYKRPGAKAAPAAKESGAMSGTGGATTVQADAERPGQAPLQPSTDPPAPGGMPEGGEAAVRLRYRMAQEHPRTLEEGKARLLRHCEQPAFAAVARYRKLVDGEWIDAPSIRFAEAALQAIGNILSEVGAIRDDSRERVIRVAVTDFESNVTHAKEVLIPKVIERAELLPGDVPLASRIDGRGQRLYTLLATGEEILSREGALVSKALRQIALRLLPGDWVHEGLRAIRQTLEAEIAQDLESAREKLAQGFAALRVERNG